jgi:hypothetical protein
VNKAMGRVTAITKAVAKAMNSGEVTEIASNLLLPM